MEYVVKLESERTLLVIKHSTMQLRFIAVRRVDHNRIVFLLNGNVILSEILGWSRANADLDTILLHLEPETFLQQSTNDPNVEGPTQPLHSGEKKRLRRRCKRQLR